MNDAVSPDATEGAIPPLHTLVPHQDAMCLLERVVDWNEQHIVLESSTHRALDHPLRREGRLHSVHLCEYGAQAMAVHGALIAQVASRRAAPGMLVSLRAVQFSRDYVEDLPHPLRIEAQRLHGDATSLQYSFRVLHDEEALCVGRAAVVLTAQDSQTDR